MRCVSGVRNSLILIAMVAMSGPAVADDDWTDDPIGNRFFIGGGIFWPHLDTVVRVDSSTGQLGTTIDFESTLGMDRTDNLPIMRGYYRFNEKHRLNFGYFKLDRSGLGVSDVEIRFGDVTFPADLPLSSFFNISVYDLTYGYTLIHTEKWDVELSIGLSLQDVEIGIEDDVLGVLKEETDVIAPLPTFGGTGSYALTDKFILSGRLGIFAIELDLDSSNIEGSVIDASVALFHKTFEHLGFGVGYNYFKVDVDYEDSSLAISGEYEYHGPSLLLAAYF